MKNIIIGLHLDSERGAQQVADELILQGLADPSDTQVFSNRIETAVEASKLSDVAAIDDVRTIDEAYQEQPHISVARGLLNCPIVAQSLLPSGVNGPAETMNGEGEVINIVDTGFDKGSLEDMHPAFTSSRCKALYTIPQRGNRPQSKAADDTDGHGTHVTGCAVADGQSLTMAGIDADQAGPIRGPAPKANFTMTQNLGLNGKTLQCDFWELVDRPYTEHQCRISNHSYGPEAYAKQPPGDYDARNIDVDQYLCSHPDLVVTWSSGNSGEVEPAEGYGQVCGRAASKNVVTVGSTMNARHIDGHK